MALSTSRTLVTKTGISTTQVFDMGGINISGGDFNLGNTIKLGNASGIITATSFVGSGSGLTGVASTDNIKTSTTANFTGGIQVGGATTLTGQTVVGSGVTLNATGVIATGVITATSFSGSGANLTSIPAGQLTGTVADARISTLTASKLSGALPAIDGSNLTGITGTTINNNADNRLITGSNSANTLEGEADLIFGADGDANVLRIAGGSSNISSSNHVSTKLQFRAKDPSTNSTNNIGASIDMIDESGNGSYQALRFQTFKQQLSPGLRETVRFTHDGHVNISDGNLKINTAGHGIDFSATTDASGMSGELLDDYEEGVHQTTVTISGNTSFSYSNRNLSYTKIGRTVHVVGRLLLTGAGGGSTFSFTLPFTNGNGVQFETSNIFQIIRGSANRCFRIRTNQSVASLETETGGSSTDIGASDPHINVNLTYMTS